MPAGCSLGWRRREGDGRFVGWKVSLPVRLVPPLVSGSPAARSPAFRSLVWPVVALLAGLGAFAGVARAQEAPSLRAYPVETDLAIDGVLDEAAWQQADVATGFRQHDPVEGGAPTFPTEVKVLYGPGHLYIGATLHDGAPSGIRATLGRRDEVNQADWFIVSIDSYFDQRTAYTFGVNAAGVQYDGLRSDGSGGGCCPGRTPSSSRRPGRCRAS